jgi:RNA polymerase sigma-70 factor, ECF subfamily
MRFGVGKARKEDPLLVDVVERDLPADPGLERAFLDVYERIHDEAMQHALLFLDRDAAWDAVQEALADIWKRWRHLTPEQRTKAYFFGAIHNCVLLRLRKDKRFVQLEQAEHKLTRLAVESIDASTGEPHVQTDLQALVDRLIGEMPPRRREVFVLARERGLSHKEVAEALGISAASVNKHLTLANEVMRSELRRAGFRLESPPQPKLLPPGSTEADND